MTTEMHVPAFKRTQAQRYSLVGQVCPHCDAKVFPPRDVCPNCHGESRTQVVFTGKGKTVSYTVMRDSPAENQMISPPIEKSTSTAQPVEGRRQEVKVRPSGSNIIYRATPATD